MSGEWGWWAGRFEERYDLGGPFKTREEAIEAGRENVEPEDFFYVIEAIQRERADLVDSGARLMERWCEDFLNSDMAGEEDDGDLCGTREAIKAAEDALDTALRAWFVEHGHVLPRPSMFKASRNEECVPPRQAPQVPA